MDLLKSYFPELIQCAATTYLAFAVFIACFRVPETDTYNPYRRSKRLLSAALMVISVNLFAWMAMYDGDWTHLKPSNEILDMLLFFLAGLLLSFCFGNLLDSNYLSRRRVTLSVGVWLVAVAAGCASLLPELSRAGVWLAVAAESLFLGFTVHFIYGLQRLYRRRDMMLDKYFTNDMHHVIRWILMSIILIVMLGVISVATLFMGPLGNWVSQIYIISTICYIAVSFVNYATKYAIIAKAGEEIDEDEQKATETTCEEPAGAKPQATPVEVRIEQRLAEWMSTKAYVKEQFTISDLALTLGTNRYTLSRYINSRYKMNFSTWISSMRIEEAERLIKENPDESLENISALSGFSSLSYFSKVFSRMEGMAPTVWRSKTVA